MKVCDRCRNPIDDERVDRKFDNPTFPILGFAPSISKMCNFSIELCKECYGKFTEIVQDWVENRLEIKGSLMEGRYIKTTFPCHVVGKGAWEITRNLSPGLEGEL